MEDKVVKKRKMPKKKTILIGGVAAGVILVAAVGAWVRLAQSDGNNKDTVVYVNTVSDITNGGNGLGTVNRFAGVVETQHEMEIQASQEKTVKEIFVEEGQEVKIGDKLFAYDTEQSADDLAKAKLELERISNSISNKKEEIATLEKEKQKASQDMKLEYTMQIQSAQMELKQSEYEQKSKEIEIEKLVDAIENAEVFCEMDGVVKSIKDGTSHDNNYGDSSSAFMTIIAMGDYRVKGKVNEQNISSVIPGQAVIVHSRVNDDTWHGVMGEVDMEKPGNDTNGYFYGGDSSMQSNSYPFYVTLDSSEGLMLGQHVYLEMDFGQEEKRTGIWLDSYFISDVDTDPFVWADNGKGKLEKRKVVLGEFDEDLSCYEIKEGLTEGDLITYPEEMLKEGMATANGANGMMGYTGAVSEEEIDLGGMEEEGIMMEESLDMELEDEVSEDVETYDTESEGEEDVQ